jgi:3-hydroxymyristoyl/3-hydroxydecanoyl-(acyl carrier protein) dehydratase
MIDARQTFKLRTPIAKRAEGEFLLTWQVPASAPYLDGHFPKNPVLPAVGIIDGSLEFVKQALSEDTLELEKVISGKFSAPITPGMHVEVVLRGLGKNQWLATWLAKENSEPPKALAEIQFSLCSKEVWTDRIGNSDC